MKSLAVCSLLVLLALPTAALEPYLVKDIDPVPAPAGSKPTHAVTLGGAVLFFANDGISGRQLWRSDGTAAGTWQVTDDPAGLGDPQPYAVTERLYFFLGTQGLWVSDGTTAGTVPLTERMGILPSRLWVASAGILYFVGKDFEHGAELWRTDGTVAGTRLVADIHEGPAGSGIRWLTEYRGRVWFGAIDEHRGGALWVTDGTTAGTVPAIDPLRSWTTKPPTYIQVIDQVGGGRLTFFARAAGPSRDLQLWAGDGTREGTAPVTRLVSRTGRPTLYESVVWGNRLYFLAEDRAGQELWVSDGTRRGTRPLTHFANPEAFFSSFDRWELPRQQGLPGRFVFVADDGVHGAEPWVTDGTPEGTRLLRDACPGECSSVARFWVALAGRLYFSAYDVEHGHELWSTDGTEAGTQRVIDLNPGSSSYPYMPFLLGDRLLFVAQTAETGQEIWSTDGTAAGTVRISDFEPEFVWIPDGFYGAVLDGQLLFSADDGDAAGTELWRTDGTAAGTRLVEDINRADAGGSRPYALRALGSQAIFVASDGGGPGLWKSDGTAAGTVRFKTFGPGTVEGAPAGASAEAGGRLFYFSPDSGLGRYLPWRTDGTEAGTFRLTEAGVAGCCIPQEMRAVGSTVFFDLQDEEHGRELWASDGTREGTRLVRDVQPGAGSSDPRELTVFQGRLWFSAAVSKAGFTGRELWVSDGTAAGTARVKDLALEGAFGPALLTVHAGRLWFFADDDEHGRVLWSSDGTAAGTVPAVDFDPEAFLGFLPRFMAALGDRLVVSIDGRGLWTTDGTGTRKIHELEVDDGNFRDARILFQDRLYYVAAFTGAVWVTDGTEQGTGPLLDRDGEEILLPSWFAVLGDRLLIAAPDDRGRLVLWQSDGTPAGTFQVQPPVFPGFGPVRAGERVFFPAYDPAAGWELWAVRP